MRHVYFPGAVPYAAAAAVLLASGSCTMNSQEAPGLTGPSEYAQSITVSASPDILTQDGTSQSLITVLARGPNGEPLPNVSMNAEIRVDGARVEFGSLSARNVVTASDGRGTFVYTAPMSPPLSIVEGTTVIIAVTPVGSNFDNSASRIATIRVIPVGPVVPPDGLAPYFTFSPATPLENQQVLFQACADPARPACAPANNPIEEYDWSFGDGSGGGGQFATHAYALAGSYTVTLRVEDAFGRSATTAQQVTVGASLNPTAAFVFSPLTPSVNQTIAFNASGSAPTAGRRIVSYTWDFGNGSALRETGGPTTTFSYPIPGSYNVTLVVKDDTGKTGAVTVPVSVTP